MVTLDESSLLIERDAAAEYAAGLAAETTTTPADQPGASVQPKQTDEPGEPPISDRPTEGPQTSVKRQFYGNVTLDPVRAKLDFATVVDEVVEQFTAKLGVDVSISVEIQALSSDGFDESTQRTVKENCNVLRFGSSEFEEQ